MLSESQLARLAELGQERTANVGDVLYRIGDRSYPFIVILEGEVAIVDSAGNEIVRHGTSKFLGELNLLTLSSASSSRRLVSSERVMCSSIITLRIQSECFLASAKMAGCVSRVVVATGSAGGSVLSEA